MAPRKIEWQIALDNAGVKRGVKGVDRELAALRRSFEKLDQVKAFAKGQEDLKKLEKELEAARVKAAKLAKEAETGGKRQQNAYAKAAAQVDKLTAAVRAQTGQLAKQSGELKKVGVSTRDVAAEQTKAEAALKSTTAELKTAATIQEFYAKTGKRSYREITQEIEQVNGELAALKKTGKLGPEELARASAAAEKKISSLNNELNDTGKKAGVGFGTAKKVVLGFGASLVALDGIVANLQLFAGFDDQLRAVKALTGATEKDFNRIKQAAYDMAGAAGGPEKIAAGMAELAASGASVDDILSTADIVGKLSGASRGALDFSSSGDLLTNTIKQLGLDMSAAVPVADRLAKGWNSAGHDGQELGAALEEVLPVVKDLYGNLGKTAPLEKAVSVINVLAENYGKGSKAGTAFKNALIRLVKPAGEGQQVLDKYKDSIRVFDDTGNIRDFADIIDDIGRAGLSSREKMALFGAEAGPALSALVNAGGDAIRGMEASIKSADGTVNRTSSTLQEGLGGSLRTASAEIEKARLAMTEDFLPALQGILSLAKYADNAVAGLSGTIKTGAAIWSTAAGGITRYLSYLEEVTDYIGVTDDATNSLRQTSDAFLDSARDLGNQAAASFKKAKDEIDPLAESQERLAKATSTLNSKYAEVSKQTGVTVTTMEELDAAVARGAIRYDEATGAWIGAEKEKQAKIQETAQKAESAAKATAEAEKRARAEAETAWKNYLNTVFSITDQIKERTGALGLSQELDELKASTLSAGEAYKFTQQRIVELGAEARKAAEEAEILAAAGDQEGAAKLYKEAVKYADEAKQLAGELNKEVKDGEQVIVSQEEAYNNAKNAVTEYGQLGIDILERWKETTQEAADTLNDQFNFDGIDESADDLKDKLGTVGEPLADSMEFAADSAIDDVQRIKDKVAEIEDKTVTITVKEVSASASGSITGAARAATGNIFMGRSWASVKSGRINPGGPSMVDNIPVITAAGETITKASSAKKIGYNVWRPYNAGDPVGMARALAGNHPQVREVFAPQVRVAPALKVFAQARPSSGGGNLPGNLIRITVNDYVDGVSYDKFMTAGSWNLEQSREQRRQNINKVVQR